jgi:hypothetical protein
MGSPHQGLFFFPPNTLECTLSAIPVDGGLSRRARGTYDVRGVGSVSDRAIARLGHELVINVDIRADLSRVCADDER